MLGGGRSPDQKAASAAFEQHPRKFGHASGRTVSPSETSPRDMGSEDDGGRVLEKFSRASLLLHGGSLTCV